jgi:carbon storage regulator
MLILSRRPNESLRIAGNVIITVVGLSGSQIRLGITAPPHVTIDREEVHQRKLAERVASLNPEAEPAGQPSGTRNGRRKLAVRGRAQPQAE